MYVLKRNSFQSLKGRDIRERDRCSAFEGRVELESRSCKLRDITETK